MRLDRLALVSLVGLAVLVPGGVKAAGSGAASSQDGAGVRALVYPKVTDTGFEAPEIRVSSAGAPVTLYFPDATIDQRPVVNFVTVPDALALTVSERNAYIYAKSAKPGTQGMATITLSGGRPLAFRLVVVSPEKNPDSAVYVRLKGDAPGLPKACLPPLQHLRDALANCQDTSGARAEKLLAGLLGTSRKGPIEDRPIHYINKEHGMYVDAIDAVRLLGTTYLRLDLENRDGYSGKTWVAGDVRVTVIDSAGHRSPATAEAVFTPPEIPLGKRSIVVIAVPTPQLAEGQHLEVSLYEAQGQRHVVIKDLSL